MNREHSAHCPTPDLGWVHISALAVRRLQTRISHGILHCTKPPCYPGSELCRGKRAAARYSGQRGAVRKCATRTHIGKGHDRLHVAQVHGRTGCARLHQQVARFQVRQAQAVLVAAVYRLRTSTKSRRKGVGAHEYQSITHAEEHSIAANCR
jgi:hypothetical protein